MAAKLSDGWLHGTGWFAAPRALFDDPRLQLADIAVLAYFCRRAGVDGAACPTVVDIVDAVHASPTTARRSVSRLMQFGWLERVVGRSSPRGGRPSSGYRLHVPEIGQTALDGFDHIGENLPGAQTVTESRREVGAKSAESRREVGENPPDPTGCPQPAVGCTEVLRALDPSTSDLKTGEIELERTTAPPPNPQAPAVAGKPVGNPVARLVDQYRAASGRSDPKKDGRVLGALYRDFGEKRVSDTIAREAAALAGADSPLLLLVKRCQNGGPPGRAGPPRTVAEVRARADQMLEDLREEKARMAGGSDDGTRSG